MTMLLVGDRYVVVRNFVGAGAVFDGFSYTKTEGKGNEFSEELIPKRKRMTPKAMRCIVMTNTYYFDYYRQGHPMNRSLDVQQIDKTCVIRPRYIL